MSDQPRAGVDLPTLYRVLCDVARSRPTTPFTYTRLSDAYARRTHVQFDPHGTWDTPLDTINRRLECAGFPPISALVVTQDSGMPGPGFWGTCARTQNVGRNADERLLEYARILNDVYDANWPVELP
jgi:hypothetical protein